MPQTPFNRDGRDYYRTTNGDGRLLSVDEGQDPRSLYPGKLAYASEEDYNVRQAEKAEEEKAKLAVDPAYNRNAAGDLNPDAAFATAPVDLSASPLSDEGLKKAEQGRERSVDQYLDMPVPPPAPFAKDGRDYYKAPDGRMLSVVAGGDPSELVEGAVPATEKDFKALIQSRSGGFRDAVSAFTSGGRAMVGQAAAGIENAVETGIQKSTGFGTAPGLRERELGSKPVSAADIYPDEFTDKAKEVREANPTSTLLGTVAADYTIQAALDTVLPGSGSVITRAGSYGARQLAAGILTEAGDSAITGDEFSMKDALFIWTPTNMAFEAVAPPVLRGAAQALGWTGKTAARGARNALDWMIERSNTRAVDDALRESDPIKRAGKFRKQAAGLYERQQQALDDAFEVIDEKIKDAPDKLFTPSALGKSVSNNATVQEDVTMRFAQSLDHAAQVTGNDTVKEAFDLLYDALDKSGPQQYGALRKAWQLLGDAGLDSPLVKEAVGGIAETLGDASTWGKAATHHAGILADVAEATADTVTRRSVRDPAAREVIDRQLERARSVAKLSDNKKLSGAVAKAEEALKLGGEVTGARAMGGALPDEVADLRKVIDGFPDRMPKLTEELTDTLDKIQLPETWTAERAETLLHERAAGRKSARAIDKMLDDAEKALRGKPAAERVPGNAAIKRARELLGESDDFADAFRRVHEADAAPEGTLQKIAFKVIDKATGKIASSLIGKAAAAAAGHAAGGLPGAVAATALEHTFDPAVRARAKQVGAWLKSKLRRHGAKALGAGLLVGSANAPGDQENGHVKAMLANAGLLVLFLPHGGSSLMGESLAGRLGALSARERFTFRQATERSAATQEDFLRRFAAGERSFEHPAFGRENNVDPSGVRDMQYTVALTEYARLHGTDVDGVPEHIKDALSDDLYYRNAKLVESDPDLLRLAQVGRFDVVQGAGQAPTGSPDLRRFGLPDPEQVRIREANATNRDPGFIPEGFGGEGPPMAANQVQIIDPAVVAREAAEREARRLARERADRRRNGHGERALDPERLDEDVTAALDEEISDARSAFRRRFMREPNEGEIPSFLQNQRGSDLPELTPAEEVYVHSREGEPAAVNDWIDDAVSYIAGNDEGNNDAFDADDLVRVINSGETRAGNHTLTPWEEYSVRQRFENDHMDLFAQHERLVEEHEQQLQEEYEREREEYGDDGDPDSAPPSSAPPSSGGPRAEVVQLPRAERGPARETGRTADVVPMRRRGEPEPPSSEPESAPASSAPTDERTTRLTEFDPPVNHAALSENVNNAYSALRETGWSPEELLALRQAFVEKRAELRAVLDSYANGEPHVRPGSGGLIELSSRNVLDREQLGIMRQELRRRNLGEGEGANVRAVIDAELASINARNALDIRTPNAGETRGPFDSRYNARLQHFATQDPSSPRVEALYNAARDDGWTPGERETLRQAISESEPALREMLQQYGAAEGSFETPGQLMLAQGKVVQARWQASGRGHIGPAGELGEMIIDAEINAMNARNARRLQQAPPPEPRPYEPPEPEITADTPDVMLPLSLDEQAEWDTRIRDATQELHDDGQNIDSDNLVDTLSRMQDPARDLEPHVEVYVRMQTGEAEPARLDRMVRIGTSQAAENDYQFDAEDIISSWQNYDGTELTPWEEYHFRQELENNDNHYRELYEDARRAAGPDSSSNIGSPDFQGSYGRQDGDGLPDDTALGEAGLTGVTVHNPEGIRNVFGRDALTVEDVRQIFALDHLKAYAEKTGNRLDTSLTVDKNLVQYRGVVKGTDFEISTTYKPGPGGKVDIKHDLLILPPEMQGKGEARKLLQDMVSGFERIGANEVTLNAAWIGQYVWAALGCRPSPEAERAAFQLYNQFLSRRVNDQGTVLVDTLNRIKSLRDLADSAVPLETVAGEMRAMRENFASLKRQASHVGDVPFDDALIGKDRKTGEPVFRAGKYFLLTTTGPWNQGLKMEIRPGTPWYEQFKLRIGASAIALGLGLREILAAFQESPMQLSGLHPEQEERGQLGANTIVSPPGAEEQARTIRDGVTLAAEALDERQQALDGTREKLAYLAHRSRLAITTAARALASPEPSNRTVPTVPGITHSAGVARFLGDNGSLREAYEARRGALKQLEQDPMGFVEDLADSLGELSDNAPELHAEVVAQTYKVAGFLRSKLPGTVGASLVRPEGATPSGMAIRQFALYYSAATDPSTVVEDVTNNRARKEQLDTLREVWPDTYSKLKLAVVEQMAKTRPTISQRIRLDLLFDFGENLDRALAPGLVATYEAARAAQLAPAGGPAGAPKRRTNPSVAGTGALGSLALGPAAGPTAVA